LASQEQDGQYPYKPKINDAASYNTQPLDQERRMSERSLEQYKRWQGRTAKDPRDVEFE